MTLDREKC